MKPLAIILAAAALVVALSGCATRMTPAETVDLIRAFHEAGCGGSVAVDVQGASGQLGGGGSASFRANGECPVGDLPPPPLTIQGGVGDKS